MGRCGGRSDIKLPPTIINRLPRQRVEGALIAPALPGDPEKSPLDQLFSCPEQLLIRRPAFLPHDAERGTKIPIVPTFVLRCQINQ